MKTEFDYYYNNVPGKGLCRNNLIYTSLISKDNKTFCQWYYNDEGYHGGHNEVVDPQLMEEKFLREVRFLNMMHYHAKDLIPEIKDIDYKNRKIYLGIQGVDFWQRANCDYNIYDAIVPDWEKQMLTIFETHAKLGIYKYSLHPSSYFVVDGMLKSFNYFFCYTCTDKLICLDDVMSHISKDRRADLFPKMEKMGIKTNKTLEFATIQKLAFQSFKTDFPDHIMDAGCSIYENTPMPWI